MKRSRSFFFGRGSKILLTLVLAIVAVAALFDWNWFRRPLIKHLAERSGREVRIEDLHVSLGWTLDPTVRLRGVYVENAPWASKQPMAVAGEVGFTFALESLWKRRWIVTRLVLVDADISMERQANGSRNWRLTHPDYRGPGVVRVLTLQARRTKIRFANGEIDLDMVAQSAPAEAGSSAVEALPNKLTVEGRYQGVQFTGAGLVGSVISFRDSGAWFGLRGYLAAGKTRVDVDGRFADIFDRGPVDAKIHLAGPSLSRLHPFLRIHPPVSRPYELEAQLTQTDDKYSLSQLKGKIGASDIAGEATYDRKPERPVATASLHSASAELQDFAFLAGMDYRRAVAATTSARRPPAAIDDAEATGAEAGPDVAKRPVSAHSFRTERLRSVDAHLQLDVKKLRAASTPLFESLRLDADLVDGALEISKLDLGVAGGHVVGSLGYDARVVPPAATARLDARDIRLERILPGQAATIAGTGAIRSQLAITAHGNSAAALLGSTTGTFAALVHDGRISNLLDAKLGLNAGKVVRLRLGGDHDIALQCGAAAFDFRNGMGKSRIMLLETEQTHTDGVGTIDLRDRSLDLLLTPQPKNPGLFTMNSSIRVQGPLGNAHYKINPRVPLQPGGSNAASGTATALFRPLLDGEKSSPQCAAALGMRARAIGTMASKEATARAD